MNLMFYVNIPARLTLIGGVIRAKDSPPPPPVHVSEAVLHTNLLPLVRVSCRVLMVFVK